MNRHWLIVIAFGLLLTGCNSIRTTPLDRSEDGCLVANPHKPIKGVPVMLRVPTHVDVRIFENDYWFLNDLGFFERVEKRFGNREVKADIIRTEQMFFVDPKRPASGTGIYGFEFNEDEPGRGYLTGVEYKSEDTTLTDSAALLGAIAKVAALNTSNDANNRNQGNDVIVSTKRTVAYRRFDINAAGFESEMQSFVETYLNNCNSSCCPDSTIYPSPY